MSEKKPDFVVEGGSEWWERWGIGKAAKEFGGEKTPQPGLLQHIFLEQRHATVQKTFEALHLHVAVLHLDFLEHAHGSASPSGSPILAPLLVHVAATQPHAAPQRKPLDTQLQCSVLQVERLEQKHGRGQLWASPSTSTTFSPKSNLVSSLEESISGSFSSLNPTVQQFSATLLLHSWQLNLSNFFFSSRQISNWFLSLSIVAWYWMAWRKKKGLLLPLSGLPSSSRNFFRGL